MIIKVEQGRHYIDKIKDLLDEYTHMLLDHNPDFQTYLDLQGYTSEYQDLDYKYREPDGRLYVVTVDQVVVGCIALRRLDESSCEMKRLFVKSECRNLGLASRLIRLLIKEAKEIGYKTMYLDTIPSLVAAIRLYRKLGFTECEPYNASPLETTIFMKIEI